MNTRNTTARATLLIAGALAATLVLAGCTTPEVKPTPTPTASATPTPTPTEVAAPQSEDEAIDAAKDAVGRYLALETQIFTDPVAPQDIPAVAEDQAADRLANFSSQMNELGGSGTGEIVFDLQSAFTKTLGAEGEEVEFGQVDLTGCYDMTSLELLKGDGSPAEMPSVRRYVVNPTAIYRPATTSWVVYKFPVPEEIVPC